MLAESVQNYAKPLKRLIAWIIDLLLIAILVCAVRYSLVTALNTLNCGISGGKIYTVSMVVGVVVATLYHAIFESSKLQATPGKLCFGLIVTDLSGQKITIKRALLRHIGKYLSELTLGIGYFLCIVSKKKQCLHDVIAKCVITQRNPASQEVSN